MNITIETGLIIVSSVILLCILASKISDRFGVPILLLFIGVGMLAGSEGIGGVYFDDPVITQYIGVIALSVILFSSGLDTKWKDIKTVAPEGISLSILGVLITALVFGWITYSLTDLSFMESFLIGAIISPTDAAAVFSIFKSKGINLRPRVASLLELESGSNDPISILLTITLIGFMTKTSSSIPVAVGEFLLQVAVGLIIGWLVSKFSLFVINKFRLGYEGLYNILLFALVFLTYGISALLHGSGFLSVYVLGVLLGKEDFLHKRSTLRFFDSSAWFSQIVLFLTLGLLVFPSHLLPVIPLGLGLAAALILVARPVAIFISLLPFRYTIAEKLLISWVGLRGAVPIVLATYPLVAKLDHADLIFNIVFFVVLVSMLLQGTLLPKVAKILKVESSDPPPPKYPLEITSGELIPSQLKEIKIQENSAAVGKAIYELGLPPGYLIVLISRQGAFIQPLGSTQIQAGDSLLALTEKDAFETAKSILTKAKEPPSG